MMHRAFAFVIVGLLCAAVFPVGHVSAVNVTVSPNHFDFSGSKGNIVTKTSLLTNLETTTVHIWVKTNVSGLTITPSNVTLASSSSASIALAYVLPTNVTSGTMTLSWNGTNITVTVVLVEDLTFHAPVEVFPSPPVSGADMVLFFTGTSRGLEAGGFLSVNGFIYSVEMKGYAVVHLDEKAYGAALLYLFGNSIGQNDSRKTFTILRGSAKEVNLTAPAEATIDVSVAATLTYGSDPMGNQDVVVVSPDGNQDLMMTDNRGKVEFTPDSIGRWKLKATAEGQTATASIDVKYGELMLGIAEETYQLGDTITIVTEPQASIDVFIDDAHETQMVADSEGLAPLLLARGGNYRLVGSLESLRGEKAFTIPRQAEIYILDSGTHTVANRIEPGKRYIVQVADSSNNPLVDASSVWISNPSGTKELLELTDGEGSWMPPSAGSYSLVTDDTETSAGNSRFVVVRAQEAQLGAMTIAIGLLVFFILVFVILFLMARQKGIPLSVFMKSMVKRKEKVELPID